MSEFKSGIIFIDKIILAPDENENCLDLLKSLDIDYNKRSTMETLIKAELIPKDGNKATDVSEWTFRVSQNIIPDWYNENPEKYENEFREAVKEYLKDKFIVFDGKIWTKIKTDEKGTYYLLDGIIEKSEFGANNNYSESYIRNKLNNGELAEKLKETFGDRLVPITTDLLSLDGLDDYGKVEGDILAIPTLDLYRECRKAIPKIGNWWWLATPDSTPSGISSNYVQYVNSDGRVVCSWYNYVGAVRPFFILQS